MTRQVDCLVFADQMDALVRGTLPVEGARQLRLHAATCPDCATQLRVHEHLVGPSLEALEARVPTALLTGMAQRVLALAGTPPEGALAFKGDPTGGGDARTGRRRVLVPALSAAASLLLFSTGFLGKEVARLREEGAALAQEVAIQRTRLAAQASGTALDPVARTAALAGSKPLVRALARRKTITVEELLALLAQLPPDRVVVTRAQWGDALQSPSPLGTPLLRELRSRLPPGEALRAGALIRALESSGIGAGVTLRTADLVDLLS